MAEQHRGTGHRKTSTAQVRITQGSGEFTINKKDIDEYLDLETLKMVARAPLEVINLEGSLDVIVEVVGGGSTGQTGAVRQSLSRILVEVDEEFRPALKKADFLTRDPRMREHKRYSLKKARKTPQFSKR